MAWQVYGDTVGPGSKWCYVLRISDALRMADLWAYEGLSSAVYSKEGVSFAFVYIGQAEQVSHCYSIGERVQNAG
jgi:hypothetical protein